MEVFGVVALQYGHLGGRWKPPSASTVRVVVRRDLSITRALPVPLPHPYPNPKTLPLPLPLIPLPLPLTLIP